MISSELSPRKLARELALQQNFRGLADILATSPQILDREFLWLDELLRVRGRRPTELRRLIWSIVLRRNGRDPATLSSLLECAIEARDVEWTAKLAELADANVLNLVGRLSYLVNEATFVADPDQGVARFDPCLPLSRSRRRWLAGELAFYVERGDSQAAQASAREIASLGGEDELSGTARQFVKSCSELWCNHTPVRKFEFIVFAHASRKLVQNAHLAPPSAGLLERSIGSLRSKFGAGRECDVTVFLDFYGSDLDIAYRRNVEDFCSAEGVGLIVNHAFGLRKQWLSAIDASSADVIGVVEQDFEFLDPAPRLDDVAQILDSRFDVNYVRVNKRKNVRAHFDRALVETALDRSLSICRTARFSNTPHFIRRAFCRRVIEPLLGVSHHDRYNSGAGGVEENINRTVKRLEKGIGVVGALTLLGNAIYGHVGHPAACEHLGI